MQSSFNPPIITIFCAFTGRWAVERWLENLKNTQGIHKPENTNLAFIIDIDEPFIHNKLKRFAEEHGYRACEIIRNSDHHPNEVRVAQRRQRIAYIKNQSKHLIAKLEGEIVVSLEDDTVFDVDCFCRLIKPLMQDPRVGFVQGVQCGRWGVKMIGAWEVDDIHHPTRANTVMPSEGYQQIDAGGFYGYATRKDLYLNHDYYSGSSQPYGPDVNYGLYVKQRGYQVIIDWDTVFGHNDHNVVLYPDDTVTKITFTKKKQTGEWLRTDEELS